METTEKNSQLSLLAATSGEVEPVYMGLGGDREGDKVEGEREDKDALSLQ